MTRVLRLGATLGKGIFLDLPTGLIAGILYSSGFPTVWGWHWGLSWLGLLILLGVLRYRRSGPALLFSFGFGMGFFLSLYIWVTASVGWWVPWAALAVLQSCFWLSWCLCATLSRCLPPILWAGLVAFVFSGFEQLRGNYPWGGSPWGYLAYTQVENRFSDLAPWLGESGISFLIVWILAAVIASVARPKQGRLKNILFIRYATCLLPALFILVAVFGGFVPKPEYPPDNNLPKLRVAAIQGNISTNFRADYLRPFRLLNNHIRQTEKTGVNDADIVLWGEQSADQDLRRNQEAQEQLTALLEKTRTPLFYGSVTEIGGSLNNNYVLLDSEGRVKQVYRKKHLVPFGEYLPQRKLWEQLIPQVHELLPRDIQPGNNDSGIFDLRQVGIPVKLGVNICFEEAVNELVRENVNSGAELLVFPTNNASFGHWAESTQQLQISRFRAKEYQRATVQISINGVSGIIESDGTLLSRSGLFSADTLHATLKLPNHLTFSARFGHYQELLFQAGSLIILITLVIIRFYIYNNSKK